VIPPAQMPAQMPAMGTLLLSVCLHTLFVRK
jgi:hypothetical protein